MNGDRTDVIEINQPKWPLIVNTAVKDALDGSSVPSMEFHSQQQRDLYDMCIASILGFMRGYREKTLNKVADAKKILNQ